MADRKLRGVAVGAGYFSQFHFEAWLRIPDVEIVAICELEEFKREETARKYRIETVYSDVEKMLDEQKPDFIDIITRPDSHFEIVKTAAQHGVNVICQKPLAPTFEEATRIVDVAESADVRLMVHENFRFQPWHREIKKLLDTGIIGVQLHTIFCVTRTGDGWQDDAYLGRQPYFVDMPRFLIYETGVHFIDTFRFLGGEIDGVYASLRQLNPNINGEDAGTVFFEFQNGARGVWDASRFHEPNCENPRYTFGNFLVEGSGGSIRLDLTGRISIQPHGEPEYEHFYNHSNKNFASDCVYNTQKHFIDHLRDDTPFETEGAEYLKTLQIQEAVYKSATQRQPVRGLISGGSDADR